MSTRPRRRRAPRARTARARRRGGDSRGWRSANAPFPGPTPRDAVASSRRRRRVASARVRVLGARKFRGARPRVSRPPARHTRHAWHRRAFVCWARESFAELDRAFLVHLLVTRHRLSRIGRSEIDARNARAGVSAGGGAIRSCASRRAGASRGGVRPLRARGDDDSDIDSCPASVSESSPRRTTWRCDARSRIPSWRTRTLPAS